MTRASGTGKASGASPSARAETGTTPDLLPSLEQRLLAIPDDKFLEVVRLLERVNDHPDVRQTFDSIRPRLVQMRPGRRPTLKRVLCMPFEDALEGVGGGDVPLSRIERRVIAPLWGIVEERADRHQLDQLDRMVQEVAPGDHNGLLNIGRRLWPLAAQTLRAAMDDDRSRQALWRHLHGDEGLQRQVIDAAAYLDIGLSIEALKSDLSPKPVPELEDRHIAAIEQAAQAVARQSLAGVYPLLLVAAARLATPADLLRVLNDLDLGKARRDQPVLFAQLSGLVVSNLEARSARLDDRASAGERTVVKPADAMATAERLIASVTTTSTVMDALHEPLYRDRLAAVTSAVGAMVAESVLDTAPQGILSAIPAPTPDRAPEVDETAQIAAEDHARALRRCDRLADTLGLRQQVNDTIKRMGQGVEQRAQALLQDYPQRLEDAAATDAAELNLFYSLRLLELLAGSAKADPLRLAILSAIGESPEPE
ncbi:hypothetical protein [Azospirillum griseum]|uniref:Uncharacterized protein n=1 Tax=Azospirillum griseum TaxID=2496639 RepID=A0A3S0KYA2_9PROT|nr:hypothetical protein [Azospirillum griseum]RTR20143.1 hypothetical protein EJ903_11380 [Azospirillum griseum]